MSNTRFEFQENAYYHIYNRGYQKQHIFRHVSDFKKFYDLICLFARMKKLFGVNVTFFFYHNDGMFLICLCSPTDIVLKFSVHFSRHESKDNTQLSVCCLPFSGERFLNFIKTFSSFIKFLIMSLSRLFTIIGDANVRRNMTALNIASREAMKSAQIVDFNGAGSFDSALASVRSESSVCIVAAITDLLLSNGDCGTISASIDPILNTFSAQIVQFCNAKPNLQVFRI